MTPHESRTKRIEGAFSTIVNALAEMDRTSINAHSASTSATSITGELRRVQENYQATTNHLIERVRKLEEITTSGQQWARGVDERLTDLASRLDRAVARLNAHDSQPLPTTRHGVPVDRVAVLRCIAGLWERLATTIERGTEHGSNVSNSVRVAMARELLDLMKFHIGDLINIYSALSPQDEGQPRKETNEKPGQ